MSRDHIRRVAIRENIRGMTRDGSVLPPRVPRRSDRWWEGFWCGAGLMTLGFVAGVWVLL